MLKRIKNTLLVLSVLSASTALASDSLVLNHNLEKPLLGAMDALNGLPSQYPNATSLAPGKPADEFCTPDIMADAINEFKAHAKQAHTIPVNRLLGQYGKVNGIINDLIAQYLKVDEGLIVSPDDILVTVGFQEAATLLTLTLFNEGDVLLIPDPGYIGMMGIAALQGIPIEPVNWEDGFNAEVLENTLINLKANNKLPKAMYVASSYCNPQGTTLSWSQREELLALADKYGFYIIEDATYNLFNYDETPLPSLKALDRNDRVIYVGSFAKSIYPALRVAFILFNKDANGLMRGLIKTKSFSTINTPALDQAIVGGILLKNDFSLKEFISYKKAAFKKNRDIMLSTLESNLSDINDVKWSSPKGGFFVTLNLPFHFTKEMVKECAQNYDVIVLPMYLLTIDQRPSHQVRLSFTTTSPEKVREAVERFSEYVKFKIKQKGNA